MPPKQLFTLIVAGLLLAPAGAVAAQESQGSDVPNGLTTVVISAKEPSLETVPDQAVRFILSVENVYDEEVTAQLSLAYDATGWARLEAPSQVSLAPGESAEFYLVVEPDQDAAPGDAMQFHVEAEPSVGDRTRGSVTLSIADASSTESETQETAGGVLTAMGLEFLAPTGIFGLLFLVLVVLIVLVLILGRGDGELVTVEEK